MYVLEEGGEVLASVILNSFQPAEYAEIPWLYPAEGKEALVIHTLCVSPRAAGRGLATKLIEFACGFAYGRGAKVIRLDTNAKNAPARRLYLRNGWRLAGSHHALHEGRAGHRARLPRARPLRKSPENAEKRPPLFARSGVFAPNSIILSQAGPVFQGCARRKLNFRQIAKTVKQVYFRLTFSPRNGIL